MNSCTAATMLSPIFRICLVDLPVAITNSAISCSLPLKLRITTSSAPCEIKASLTSSEVNGTLVYLVCNSLEKYEYATNYTLECKE